MLKYFVLQNLTNFLACSDTCEPFYVDAFDQDQVRHWSNSNKRVVSVDTKLKHKLVSKCKVLQGVKSDKRDINVSLHIFSVNCNLPAKYVCEPPSKYSFTNITRVYMNDT